MKTAHPLEFNELALLLRLSGRQSGDTLGTCDHGAVEAAILQPFVSEANYGMLENHPTFQGYYYFHHLGDDRNARDRLKGHRHYEHTRAFVEKYGMPAFDPDYDTLPLEDFVPMVRRVMSN